jgi:hypothetical protein
MKFTVLAAAMLLVSLPTMAQKGGPPLIVHQDGLFGQALLVNDAMSIDLNVSRALDDSGQPETFLVLNTFQETSDGFVFTFGSGVIPDGSLQGDNPAHVVLDVDTSQLTNFNATTCTAIFVLDTETCVPTPGGLIHLEWRKINFAVFHETVELETTFPQGRINNHQVADGAAATLTGTVFGLDASSGSGQIGINHGSNIAITTR